MRRTMMLAGLAAGLALTLACDEPKDDTGDSGTPDVTGTATATATATTGTGTGATGTGTGTTSTGTGTGATGTGTSNWRFGGTPCASRTDDLWFDDATTGYLGCGQASDPAGGMWKTTDGGLTWGAVVTDPAGFMDSFRVDDIFRDSNGLLHAAGTGPNSLGVVAIESDGSLTEVWLRGSITDESFTAGTFNATSTGFAVVESLTGYDMMTRADGSVAADGWDVLRTGWATDGQSHQLLDLVVYDDKFYGCGSRIGEPPKVFLPTLSTGTGLPGLALDTVEMSSGAFGWAGELWSIDVDAGGIVVGGVDQDADSGHVFTIDDPAMAYDPANWRDYDLGDVHSEPTWIRGVCRSTAHVVAVGEYSTRNAGIVLVSSDGGATFTDMTPVTGGQVPTLWDCAVHPDGSFVVTGAGFAARYRP